jgi:molybdopterin synthase sulfur carrier subunit
VRIIFHIPGSLRQHTGGLGRVEVDVSGTTVREALNELWRAHPFLRDRVLTEQGEVRRHVNIFVDEENIRYCGGFGAVVKNGSYISIIPAVSGGAQIKRG